MLDVGTNLNADGWKHMRYAGGPCVMQMILHAFGSCIC